MLTPLATPVPPFASRIMALRTSSLTSSLMVLATARRSLSWIGPSEPLVNSLKAASISSDFVSSDLLLIWSAQSSTK